jgi:hypothetical protein
MNLFSVMYLSSRFAITAKKILPIVLVRAIGRNSAGSLRFADFASSWIDAVAHSAGTSFVAQTFLKIFTRSRSRHGHLLKGTYKMPSTPGAAPFLFSLMIPESSASDGHSSKAKKTVSADASFLGVASLSHHESHRGRGPRSTRSLLSLQKSGHL